MTTTEMIEDMLERKKTKCKQILFITLTALL